jgi:V-type H+-transporting ATPase subunit G
VDADTASKLEEVSAAYAGNKDAVVKKLMDRVVLVEPALHRNLKKIEA